MIIAPMTESEIRSVASLRMGVDPWTSEAVVPRRETWESATSAIMEENSAAWFRLM